MPRENKKGSKNVEVSLLFIDFARSQGELASAFVERYTSQTRTKFSFVTMMSTPPTRALSASPNLRRSRRIKTVSSLQGMFEEQEQPNILLLEKQGQNDDLKSVDSFDSMDTTTTTKYSVAERDSLRLMSRRLRQAKRKLLLKCVETPEAPVDKLRDLLLKLSVDASDDCFSTSVNSLSNTHD